MSMIIRQGDVLLRRVQELPAGAQEVPLDGGRIVLAYGEVTGHAHAIEVACADHGAPTISAGAAEEIAEALIARCRAKLYERGGDLYLVVSEPVSLTHEEHTTHLIPPGVYEVPVQMEYDAALMRRVTD